MKTLHALFLAALLGAPVAHAAESAPEYLLGDLGVRVDLPRGWNMLRWSDWDFKAETADRGVMLFAWASPYQVPIADAAPWAKVYEEKIAEMGGASPKLVASEIEQVGGRDVARLELGFTFGGSDAEGVLHGATLTIAGQDFHLATVSARQNAGRSERALGQLLDRLEIREEGEPLETVEGGTVSASGVDTKLPAGWREPLKTEVEGVMKRVRVLGLEDLSACWTAMRPRPAAEPDVMVTCQGGLSLGVVDDFSFAGVDPVVRERMFGAAPVPPAEKLELSDRLGFLYAPELDQQGLAVAVVPYDQGIARTWVLGQPDDATLAEAARAAVLGSTYSGPHPATFGEQASYYLTYRPLSPVVLGPAALGGLVLLGAVGGGAFALSRGRRKGYDDLDDI